MAIGIVETLNYFHDGCSHPIIHRDVKSSNIFLSEEFEPQVLIFVRKISSQALWNHLYILVRDAII